MRMSTVLNKMLGVQGLWVRDLRLRVEEKTLWLNVVPRWRISRCGSCGRKVRHRHDRSWRSWRHLDVFGWQTYLRYAIWRVKCPHCGVRTERVPWAPVGSRFTRDFEHQVAWLAQRCDLTAVAEYFRISWATVRNIVSRVIEQEWDPEGALDGLRIIGVDEISYRRHHRYLTVVVDHVSGRVVWAGKERKVKTLLRFFHKLGPERAARLEAISADMWEPYLIVLRRKAPQARVIFDRFHIVRHLNEAVTQVPAARPTGRSEGPARSEKHPVPGAQAPAQPDAEGPASPRGTGARQPQALSDHAPQRRFHGALHLPSRGPGSAFPRRLAAPCHILQARAHQKGRPDGPQPLRWCRGLGAMADQQRAPRRHEQPHPPAQSSQLWTPLCRSTHLSRLPLLRGSRP